MSTPLIEVKDLQQYFPVRRQGKTIPLKAVDGISFQIQKGETLGLVGESGCGKSTTGRTLIRLHEPTGGQIFYDGVDITKVKMLPYRKKMQMVFQDPYSSLDPRMTVGDLTGEMLDIHKVCKSRKEREEIIVEQLRLVGLNTEHMNRFPHEFSGGQRQRISIARALAIKPDFMVCDEPVSALDVSIQAQVINMLMELQQRLELTYLFIAHDLSVVRHISKRVAVMYLGHIVESNDALDLYKHPAHPYTQALLSSIPVPDPKTNRSRERYIIEGDVPSPINPPKGCPFGTRCTHAKEVCREVVPKLEDVAPGHQVACHMVRPGW